MNSVQEFGRVAATQALPNAAKPAKRVAEDESSQRPGITRIGALSQNDDTKRRRTGDEDLYDPVTRPTMAPPIRQSNIRKVRLLLNKIWIAANCTDRTDLNYPRFLTVTLRLLLPRTVLRLLPSSQNLQPIITSTYTTSSNLSRSNHLKPTTLWTCLTA